MGYEDFVSFYDLIAAHPDKFVLDPRFAELDRLIILDTMRLIYESDPGKKMIDAWLNASA